LEKSEKELLQSVKEKSLKTSIALAAESTVVGTLSKPDGGLDDILLDGSTQPLADGMHVEALNACAQSYLDSVDPASDLRACAACGIRTFESDITVDHDRCRRLSLSDARVQALAYSDEELVSLTTNNISQAEILRLIQEERRPAAPGPDQSGAGPA
jgi:hypothetical protein